MRSAPGPIVARLRADGAPAGAICDAVRDDAACAALLDMMRGRRVIRGVRGDLRAMATPALEAILGATETSALRPVALEVEQSNSSVVFGGKLIHELGYELASRPEWAWVPCEAILEIAAAPAAVA